MTPDVSQVFNSVLATVSKVQELGNNWYKESAEWEDFPRKVNRLRRTHKLWEDSLTQFGMLGDELLMPSLKDALELLEKEEKLLQSRKGGHSCVARCWPKLSGTLFPEKIGLRIQNVINAFDEMRNDLRLREEIASGLQQEDMRRPFSTLFHNDDRYVHLRDSERDLYQALRGSRGPAVVLLHGGQGTGKSTLARQICVQFKEEAKPATFDHVFLLECGPVATTVQKQFELLRMVGGDHGEGEKPCSDFEIRKRLAKILKHAKMLIVLDDVFYGSTNFELHEMLELFGSRVKCLVTAHSATVCQDLPVSCMPIRIRSIKLEDARKILASHVGLPDQHIPTNLQMIADEMIEAVEANPLALASLATALDFRSPNPDEWDAALSSLSRLLSKEDTARIFGTKYPRSYVGTMRLRVNGLDCNWSCAQALLILTAICEGPSIPEFVIQILCKGVNSVFRGNASVFYESRKELANRELLQTRTESLEWNNKSLDKRMTWSMHSLQKKFILEEMRNAVDHVLASFAGDSESESSRKPGPSAIVDVQETEEALVRDMCALYCEKTFFDRVATTVPIPLEKRSLRRSAVEPIVWLLGQRVNTPRWTESARQSSMKVFHRYIREGILDDDGVSELLGMQVSILATFQFLKDVSFIDPREPMLDEDKTGILNSVLALLRDERDITGQELAVRSLAALASSHCHRLFIGSFEGILEALVASLSSSSLQNAAAMSLGDLATESSAMRMKIMGVAGVLDRLVELLSKDHSVLIQQLAAMTLGNLAFDSNGIGKEIASVPGALGRMVELLPKGHDVVIPDEVLRLLGNLALDSNDIGIEIASVPGALGRMVELLSKGHDVVIQGQVLRVLSNLTSRSNETSMKIIGVPGVLNTLVELLSEDPNATIQEGAALTLANLAIGSDERRIEIASVPGVHARLGELLSQDHCTAVQEKAAMAFANLAYGLNERKMEIASVPGVLGRLVELLSKDHSVAVQDQAVRALAYLTLESREIRMEIIRVPGVSTRLVELLSDDNPVRVQENVTKVLGHLALEVEQVGMEISQIPGALVRLVDLLSKGRSAFIQSNAAVALAHLAVHSNEIRMEIITVPGVLPSLVELLSEHHTAKLQETAALVLGNLAIGCKIEIASVPGLLERLVELLSEEDGATMEGSAAMPSHNLIEHDHGNHTCVLIDSVVSSAALLLGSLALGVDEIGMKIAQIPGALIKLVELLFEGHGASIQVTAARVLAILACQSDERRTEIIGVPGVMSNLVELLSEQHSARAQQTAALVITNLSNGSMDIRMEIERQLQLLM